MAKKNKIKYEVLPDPIYDSLIVAKFINQIMKRGKKQTAQKIMYQSLDIIKERTKKDALEVFEKAIYNVSPILELKPRRVGGATYQVPVEVKEKRKLTLAIRWLIGAARAKKGKPMREKLADEFISASNNEGAAIKKREDVHRMAEANRAFAHFAW